MNYVKLWSRVRGRSCRPPGQVTDQVGNSDPCALEVLSVLAPVVGQRRGNADQDLDCAQPALQFFGGHVDTG
jgi:hypothetical protein